MTEQRYCDNCGKALQKDAILYHIRIEILASPEPPDISEEDLEEDHLEKLNQLVEAMEDLDPQEALDEVYEVYQFNLCPPCRDDFHKKLKLTGKQQFLE